MARMGISSSFGSALGALAKKLGVTDFVTALRESAGVRTASPLPFDPAAIMSAIAPLVQAWMAPKPQDSSIATLRLVVDRQGRLGLLDFEDRYANLPVQMRAAMRHAVAVYEDVLTAELQHDTFAEPLSADEVARERRERRAKTSTDAPSDGTEPSDRPSDLTTRGFFAPSIPADVPLKFHVYGYDDDENKTDVTVGNCALLLLDAGLGKGQYRVHVIDRRDGNELLLSASSYEVADGDRDMTLLDQLHRNSEQQMFGTAPAA